MKKILIALALGATLVGSAQAQWHHHGYQGGYRAQGGGNWIAPLIIGGIAGAVIARESTPVVVQQQPVYVQQPPQVIVQQQQPQGFVQCPPGTMPFEQRGWVRNPWGQWIQSTYIDCR
jgi:hypothetical protein